MARKSLTDFSRAGQPTIAIVVPPPPTEAQIQQFLQSVCEHARERDELLRRHTAVKSTISSKPVQFADITGRRSGRLTAKEFERVETTATGRVRQLWLCECACGRTRVVANTDLLGGGRFKSCEQCAIKDSKLRGKQLRHARVLALQARSIRVRMERRNARNVKTKGE
jgi:hypothetical protein